MRNVWGWALVFGLICHGSAEAQVTANRGTPSATDLARYGLEVAWTGQAVLNPARDHVQHVSMDEEVVFVQGSNGILTAFDAESGQKLWAQKLGSFDGPAFPAATNEEIVMAVVETSLYGLNKLTGDIAWEIRLPASPSTGPSADEEQVYVGTLDGSVYAFNLKKIRELYLAQRLPEWSYQTIVWRFQASMEITSPPIPLDQSVTFASRDKSVYSVGKQQKKLNYQFETEAPIVASMAQVGQTLFFATEDFTFYAVNAGNGAVLWEFVTGLPTRVPPVALGNSLYLSPERGGLYCLDIATGEQKWWQPRLGSFVSLVGQTVVARDRDNNLALVDATTGRLKGRMQASSFDVNVINNRSDRIYLANSRGLIMALREEGRSYPLFHRYPERRPILPVLVPEDEAAEETPNPPEPAPE